MSDIILKAENISKQYRLGLVGTGTISHDLNRWWYKIRGKQDPYLKVGEANDRSTKGNSDYVWALKDINFEGSFCLCGYGEPMLHKEFYEIIDKLGKLGGVEIITNGDLINKKTLLKLYNSRATKVIIR